VDLSVTSTHTGTFVAGGTGQYIITVSNSAAAGIEREDNIVTVRDTLPAGLTYSSASGTGWTCGAVGQLVTCTHAPTLNPGASFPPLTITVNVLEAAAASVINSVVVSTTSYELVTLNNTGTDTTATLDPNLSTSTKAYVDLNGGEASPGDIIRYTVTLRESAGGQAVNVSMTDSIPDNTTFASFFAIPAGATSTYAPPPAGPINNGLITVSGITVPASGSVTVVFDVTVIAGTLPGEYINNTATINNPNGPETNPAALQIQVNPSLIPANGTKFLYLRRTSATARNLSRNRPSAATDSNESVAGNGNDAFVITPALRGPLTIPTGNIPVRLWLSRSGGNGARDVTVTLSSTPGGTIATQTASVNPNNDTTPALVNFSLNNTAVRNLAAGTTLTLTVANTGSNAFLIWPNGNGLLTGTVPNNSRIELNTTTVINVDSVLTYNAAYNTGAVQSTFYPNANVFVRAQISDPFGAFDISNARITITDPTNIERVNALMTPQSASGCGLPAGAICIFQTQYAVPSTPALGTWRIRVTGLEGVEDTVTDYNLGEFTVAIPQPALTILKISRLLSDPVNNTTSPKHIALAVVQYEVTVTNSGPGTVDAGTLVITDAIPPDVSMYVSTSAGPPVAFTNGTPVSGLTYDYATHVRYSSAGVTGPWTYTPMPDPTGYDPAVRAVMISPAGVMNAAGSGNPAFTVQFRVRIK